MWPVNLLLTRSRIASGSFYFAYDRRYHSILTSPISGFFFQKTHKVIERRRHCEITRTSISGVVGGNRRSGAPSARGLFHCLCTYFCTYMPKRSLARPDIQINIECLGSLIGNRMTRVPRQCRHIPLGLSLVLQAWDQKRPSAPRSSSWDVYSEKYAIKIFTA